MQVSTTFIVKTITTKSCISECASSLLPLTGSRDSHLMEPKAPTLQWFVKACSIKTANRENELVKHFLPILINTQLQSIRCFAHIQNSFYCCYIFFSLESKSKNNHLHLVSLESRIKKEVMSSNPNMMGLRWWWWCSELCRCCHLPCRILLTEWVTPWLYSDVTTKSCFCSLAFPISMQFVVFQQLQIAIKFESGRYLLLRGKKPLRFVFVHVFVCGYFTPTLIQHLGRRTLLFFFKVRGRICWRFGYFYFNYVNWDVRSV